MATNEAVSPFSVALDLEQATKISTMNEGVSLTLPEGAEIGAEVEVHARAGAGAGAHPARAPVPGAHHPHPAKRRDRQPSICAASLPLP